MTDPVRRLVREDPHRPGAEAGRVLEARQSAGDREPGLLGDVPDRIHAAGHPPREVPQAGLVSLDEERDGNVCYRYAIDHGDVDAIFASADIVVEGDYTFPGVYQYAMETHTVIADAGGSDITVWAT